MASDIEEAIRKLQQDLSDGGPPVDDDALADLISGSLEFFARADVMSKVFTYRNWYVAYWNLANAVGHEVASEPRSEEAIPSWLATAQRIEGGGAGDIHVQLIPPASEGCDMFGQARTGLSNTAAFAVPILKQVILKQIDSLKDRQDPQVLIIVPTPELADQLAGEIERLTQSVRLEVAALSGEKNIDQQLRHLENGAQIVIGTPGRIHHHLQRGTLRTSNIWCVVLNEADRMLDGGLRPLIEWILRHCPRDRQTLLLSATLPSEVQRLADFYMDEPKVIGRSKDETSIEMIEQRYFIVSHDRKHALLERLLHREQPEQAIIFCRTKRGVVRLQRQLSREFASTGCIHGDMKKRERDRVLQKMRDGELKILVATDVVGRRIDVTTISHVVNFDVPQEFDDYVHRVSRTDRIGRVAIAFTFVCPGEGDFLTSAEQRISKELICDEIEGIDPTPPSTQKKEDGRQAVVDPETRQPRKELFNPRARRKPRRR